MRHLSETYGLRCANVRKRLRVPINFSKLATSNQLITMSAARPLSNIQQELLKLYSSDIAEADLLHIKRYLAKYFAFKAIGDADAIWDQKGYTNETMDQWLTR
jgi:hypothetical protein